MVLLGVIIGAHGIKGEVKLKSFASDPEAIAKYGALVTSDGEEIEIARLKPQKDGFVAVLKGISDRNRAESLRGRELYISRDRLPDAGANEVYVHDLIGLPVRLKDGSHLGAVTAVPNYGAGNLIEVKVKGRRETVLVPFTARFVLAHDLTEGLIVDLPEGYLDEGE